MGKKVGDYFVAFCDAFWLIFVFYITLFVRKNLNSFGFPELTVPMFHDFSFVIIVSIMLLFYEKIYTFRYDFWQETLKIFRALFLSYLVVILILVLLKINLEYSRSFILLYFIFAIVTLPIYKRFVKRVLFYFMECCHEKILIIGNDTKEVKTFQIEIEENWYLGQINTIKNYEKVIIISKGFENKELNKIIDKYLHFVSEIFVVPYLMNINFLNSNILEYSNIRRNTIQIQNKLLIKRNLFIKNSFDKITLLFILPFFAIIHLIIGIVIKLNDGGRIFFKQKRLGKDGKVFEVYKYRTMVENGNEILEEYLKKYPDEKEYYELYHKYKDDPRITKVGKFLRATSLDELPQILNVLQGDMSLVGPRPYMTTESQKLGSNKEFILRTKPGITGLWQVNGRNNLSFQERNELEVWYIKNWSLWADFVILVKTIKVVLSKVGAK